MYGSDWFMGEAGKYTFSNNYASNFEMLRLVTQKLNKKFDAWYEFTVVNPLHFLGLIDDDAAVDKTKIEGEAKKKLEKYISNIHKKVYSKTDIYVNVIWIGLLQLI